MRWLLVSVVMLAGCTPAVSQVVDDSAPPDAGVSSPVVVQTVVPVTTSTTLYPVNQAAYPQPVIWLNGQVGPQQIAYICWTQDGLPVGQLTPVCPDGWTGQPPT